MKPILPTLLVTLTLLAGVNRAATQGSAFSYQGRLNDNGAPANGIYDLRFTIYDALTNGSAVAGPLTNMATSVGSGLFTVSLDFGAGVFTGPARWLEIAVRTNDNSVAFTNLSPRAALGAVPYAIFAGLSGNVTNAAISPSQLQTAGLPGAGQVLTYNGSSLVWQTPAGSNTAWTLNGNADVNSSSFIGTTIPEALNFKVYNGRALHLQWPAILVGGSEANAARAEGDTIGGGGSTEGSQVFTNIFTNVSVYWSCPGCPANPACFSDPCFVTGGATNYSTNIVTYYPLANLIGFEFNSTNHAYNGLPFGNPFSTICGGAANTILSQCSVIAGGRSNWANYYANGSVIGGGEYNLIQGRQYSYGDTTADHATISGGVSNIIQSENSTIGGGSGNKIQTNAYNSTIGGGIQNTIQLNDYGSTMSGGAYGIIQSDASYSTIAGGFYNLIRSGASLATIGGGYENTANGYSAAVGGGYNNLAWGDYSTVGGGGNNSPSGSFSTIGGGYNNSSSGYYSVIPGGFNNSASGTFSFAAGRNCNVLHDGCFMWSDGTLSFSTGGPNRFYALATGGFYCYTGSGVGVQVAGGGNAWSPISDRNVKENFEPVDCRAVLEKVAVLPVTTWNLKTQAPQIRHIGAMAQDFKAAFSVGEDDRHISTSDADGVALAAIQGLNLKVEVQSQNSEVRIQKLEAENTELKQRLERLEQLMNGAAK